MSWREGAGGAVAAGRNHAQLALQLRPVGQVGDVARREIVDELIGAALAGLERGVEHDLLQPSHLVRAEGHRAIGAHLHAGPAIVVMRGGDHRNARHVEIELREIGHRRQRKPDVAHPHAGRHHAGGQRHLHRRGIAAEIVSGDDIGLDAHFMHQRADAHAEPLHAHQVDFLAEQPARVVFAKPGRLHHRLRFVGIGIRRKLRRGLRKHDCPRRNRVGGNRSKRHR